MDSDLDDGFYDTDARQSTGYNKIVIPKYNDGYSEGRSAGSRKAFCEDFKSGFDASYPIFLKLFQLTFTVDRCLKHYKQISFSKKEMTLLKTLQDILKSLMGQVLSNMKKNAKENPKEKRDCDAAASDESLNLSLKEPDFELHDKSCKVSKEALWKDLTIVCDYLDGCKNLSCFRNTRIEEIISALKELLKN